MSRLQHSIFRNRSPSRGDTALVAGNYRPAIAVARSLAAMGYRVVLGAEPGSIGAESSRFVDEVWRLPEAELGVEAFRAALELRLGADKTISVILPMNELMLNRVEAVRDVVPPGIRIAAPQGSVLRICHDKFSWLRICVDAGIETPPFETAVSLAELRQAIEAVDCPVVIRPVEAGKRIGKRKAVSLYDLDDLGAAFPAWPSELNGLLVQTRFDGDRYNIYFGARDGKLIRELHSRSLRTDRWDGSGQTIDGRMVPPVAVHSAMLAKATEALGYTGIGCAQFLHDPATGESCFLEINPRFGASYVFVERAGFQLTQLALELAESDKASQPLLRSVRSVRFVWSYGDLSGLGFSIRNGDVTFGQAIRWAAAAIGAAFAADVHVTWSWSDPIPTIRFYGTQLMKIFRRPASVKADGANLPASTKV